MTKDAHVIEIAFPGIVLIDHRNAHDDGADS